jgi:hypothetical protein
MLDNVYEASPVKRKRATKDMMQERREFVQEFANHFAPVTVRQVFYAATVHGIVEKTEDGYNKIQQMCLIGRRDGTIPYDHIADNSRSYYLVKAFDSLANASNSFAQTYKRDFWAESTSAVEVWLEKEALAGVVMPVTSEYRVRLVPTRGFASETIVYSAISSALEDGKTELYVKTLYDFDRSGQDAEKAIVKRMGEIGADLGLKVFHQKLALTYDQITSMNLPTRPAKKKSAADAKWKHDRAVELDAIPPNVLRSLVSESLEIHMPSDIRAAYKEIERQERATIRITLSDLTD